MIRPLPDAVIFDMDGLLIDSERLARASTLAVSEQLGHPIPEPVAMRMIGLGNDALERMLRDDIRGGVNDGEAMGIALANKLLAAGADKILAEVYQTAAE